MGVQSVSFPALGTGKMGVADVVRAMLDGIEKFASGSTSPVKNINIVTDDASNLHVFLDMDTGDAEEVGRLSNGTVVSLIHGDITTDSSDVIVAPRGLVFDAVTRKSPQTVKDLFMLFGVPNPVADLAAGGQLLCRRVYAVSVPPRSPSQTDDDCVRTIQNIVQQCLYLADASGYLSIAIPAIGTGGLGYSNRQTAVAVVEASKAFATEYPFPNLRHIKVIVVDGYRISDFQQEHQALSRGRSKEEPRKSKQKKKILKTFSAGEEDLGLVTVFATSCSTCQSVHTALREVVSRYCLDIYEDIENIPEGFDINEIHTLAARSGVAFGFDVQSGKEGTAKLTLSGFKPDVKAIHTTILQRLNKALKDEADAATCERILVQCRWCWQSDDGLFQPYSDEATVKIETAREAGETIVKISSNEIEYEIDIPNLVQKSFGRKTRKIIRKEMVSDAALPASWTDPGGGRKDSDLYVHKLLPSDPEYQTVYQAFVTSGGSGVVVSIERVQNPMLYRRYLLEKEILQKRRQKEISLGTACLEVKAFYPTNENSVDRIVNNGFNRSQVRLSRGKRFPVCVAYH